MNSGGFSFKRFFGLSAAKTAVSRKTGVPFTKGGRQRKLGKTVTSGKGGWLNLIITFLLDR